MLRLEAAPTMPHMIGSVLVRGLGGFTGRCQPATATCRGRASDSWPAGASRTMTLPAPMVAPSPTVTGATSTQLEPMLAPAPMTVRCLLAPS